jgi:aminoethylphosphonate catabolism LysR family transcriptional regulator
MRYVQLRAFHYVAISGGFSRAAEALCLTQPAISDQVRKLEEEYDVLLFNRHKKQVSLTDAGVKLLEITHRLFEVEQQALDFLSESRVLRAGKLRIMADAAHHILGILGAFREKYPSVQISVQTGNSEEVISSLYRYEADIGVLGEVPKARDFLIHKLNSSPIIAFVARDHPLSRFSNIDLAELLQWPLVFREKGSKTRQKLEDLALEKNVVLKPAIEAEGREAVREIVAGGAGIGFVSMAEFSNDSRLHPLSINTREELMDETLICLQERSNGTLINAFFKIATEEANILPPNTV